MASEKEEVKFVLDLDTKQFIEGVGHSLEKIVELGESKNLAGLIEGLGSAALAVGALGVAFLTAKTAFELVLDSEKIKSTNQQFELLSKNAGIFSKELKEGLLTASGGLIDDTDLLNSANGAIVKLGHNAEKLPELMEAARKASLVMGGTVLENFEKINHAIATGSQRMLAQLGLKVDITKAEQEYASKLGVTVDALSESGKQHARIEAVLRKSEEAYKGINGQVLEATNLYQQIKVAIHDMGEVVTLVFGTILKPWVTSMLGGLKELTHTAKTFLNAFWGEDEAKAEAGLERLSDKLLQLKNRKLELESGNMSMFDKIFGLSKEEQLNNVNREIALTTLEVSKLNSAVEKTKEKSEEAGKSLKAAFEADNKRDTGVDYDKRKEQETKFQEELLRIRKNTAREELDLSVDVEKTENLIRQEKILNHQEEANRINEINNQIKKGTLLKTQGEQLKVQAHKQAELEDERIDKKLEDERIKTLERDLARQKNFFKQVQKQSELSAAKSAKAWKDSGGAGALAMRTFQASFENAMVAMGEGSQNAADIMQGAFLNALADIAQYMGAEMVAEGIGTYDYVKAAGGTALLVLSGVIRGAARGGKSGGGGESSAGSFSGGEGISARISASDTSSQLSQNQKQPQKTVTVQVQTFTGEMSTEAKNRLLEIVREATDATDFRYVQIGNR